MKYTRKLILLGLAVIPILFLHIQEGYATVTFNGNVTMITKSAIVNETKGLSVDTIKVNSTGIKTAYGPNDQLYLYQFNRTSSSNAIKILWQSQNSTHSDWKVLTTGITDAFGTGIGLIFGDVKLDGIAGFNHYISSQTLNWFTIGSHTLIDILLHPNLTVNVYKSDGTTALAAGTLLQANSSSSNNAFTITSGTTIVSGLTGNQNFTVRDSSTAFVVKKQINHNATGTIVSGSYVDNISSDIYDITCPQTGAAKALEIETNGTDGHYITAFDTPTCYSNSTVKWHVYFSPNGNNAKTFTSSVRILVLNNTYGINPSKFTVNGSTISTSFVTPYIISNSYNVGTGYQAIGEYYSMNLAFNPAYEPVNYTAGFLTFNQSNPVTFPISFSQTNPTCTESDVNIQYPQAYNLQVLVNYAVEQKTLTYNNPPSVVSGVGLVTSTFKFQNATNDVITITATNLNNLGQTSTYSVQPNQSCLNTNTNSRLPLVQDIKDFQSGKYGTKGNIGAINVVVLIALIFGMIGLNRVNEALGMVVMIMIIGALAYFNIITWPSVMVAAIALVALIGIGSSKKLPWS